MSNYKELWVENGSFIYGCTDKKENLNGWRADNEGPWHVIEQRALIDEAEAHKQTAGTLQIKINLLEKRIAILIDALAVYAIDDVIGTAARKAIEKMEEIK